MSGSRGAALARAAALGVGLILLSPVSPLVLLGIPLALQLVTFRWHDPLPLAAGVLVLLMLLRGVGGEGPALWFAERGWALLVGGGFVAATVWLGPGSGVVTRGVFALGVAFAAVALVGALEPDVLRELDWLMEHRLDRAADRAAGWMSGVAVPGGAAEGAEETWARIMEWQVRLYPGSLGLASLASLGVGWYVVSRLEGREGLVEFREFRFLDQLVWVLVGGLLLLLLPSDGVLVRVGSNAVFLMAGLYLLRGVAVLLWVEGTVATSAWTTVAWTAIAVLLYPLAVAAALVIGLGDTWVDVRSRVGRSRRDAG